MSDDRTKRRTDFMLRTIAPQSQAFTSRNSLTTRNANSETIDSLMLKNILKNVNFSMNYITDDVDDKTSGAVKLVIDKLFKQRINASPNKSALGGEEVLTVINPNKLHDTSIHLMYFNGTQDKHFHPGPRVVTVFADKPWSFYVGDKLNPIPKDGKLNMIEVKFPGNSLTTISMAEKTLHGFRSKNMGAISVHYTDKNEVKEFGLSPDTLKDKDIMGSLTRTPDQSRINVIASIEFDKAKQIKGCGLSNSRL